MYAIVATGGKQVRVSPGDVVRIEKPTPGPLAPGDKITLSQISFLGDGKSFQVGAPVVEGAKVSATVLSGRKAPKVLIFKKKRRKQFRRTRGHRQPLVEVRIDSIEA
jgi:large subunit ribosomal protein L21